jgi:hypothetical protein
MDYKKIGSAVLVFLIVYCIIIIFISAMLKPSYEATLKYMFTFGVIEPDWVKEFGSDTPWINDEKDQVKNGMIIAQVFGILLGLVVAVGRY